MARTVHPARKGNRNVFRAGEDVQGIFMTSEGVAAAAEQWGTLALATTAAEGDQLSHRLAQAALGRQPARFLGRLHRRWAAGPPARIGR